MKKILPFLMLMLSAGACAQKIETNTEFPTGYLGATNFDASNTIKSIDGVLYIIYDDIPVALVKYPAMNPREEFEVPSTVRRICNNAFQGTKYLKTLKLHNIVTQGRYVCLNIGESAFNDSSIENFVVIENDGDVVDNSTAPTLAPRKEIATYDLAGRKTSGKQEGLQIVLYDDRSTEKVMKN